MKWNFLFSRVIRNCFFSNRACGGKILVQTTCFRLKLFLNCHIVPVNKETGHEQDKKPPSGNDFGDVVEFINLPGKRTQKEREFKWQVNEFNNVPISQSYCLCFNPRPRTGGDTQAPIIHCMELENVIPRIMKIKRLIVITKWSVF